MSTDDGNGTVSYTVKELLARQDGKLDSIILGLAQKADKTELDNLRGRVDVLAQSQSIQSGASGFLWKALPLIISAIATATAVFAVMGR
jgi:hypothetical protein